MYLSRILEQERNTAVILSESMFVFKENKSLFVNSRKMPISEVLIKNDIRGEKCIECFSTEISWEIIATWLRKACEEV